MGPVLPLTLLAAVAGLLATPAPQPPRELAPPAPGLEVGGHLIVTGDQPPERARGLMGVEGFLCHHVILVTRADNQPGGM